MFVRGLSWFFAYFEGLIVRENWAFLRFVVATHGVLVSFGEDVCYLKY